MRNSMYDYSHLVVVKVEKHHPDMPQIRITCRCDVCGKTFSVNGARADTAKQTVKDRYKNHCVPGTNKICWTGARSTGVTKGGMIYVPGTGPIQKAKK